MPELKKPSKPRTMKPLKSDESASRMGPLRKKSRVKLDRALELFLSASKSELFPKLEGREAPIKGCDGVLSFEDFTTMPLSMLRKSKY